MRETLFMKKKLTQNRLLEKSLGKSDLKTAREGAKEGIFKKVKIKGTKNAHGNYGRN